MKESGLCRSCCQCSQTLILSAQKNGLNKSKISNNRKSSTGLGIRNYLKWLGVAAFLMSIVPSTESAALNQNSLEAVGPPDARDAAENILPPYSSEMFSQKTRRKRSLSLGDRFGKREPMSEFDRDEEQSSQADELQGLEDQLEDAVGVRERRGDSGFVRFGKRKMPGGIPRGKRMDVDNDAIKGADVKRGSSGFVRFGKRMPGGYERFGKRADFGDVSYSECVARTVAQAVDRTDLLNLLVANGCIRRRMPLQQNYVQVKKDSFVRFG